MEPTRPWARHVIRAFVPMVVLGGLAVAVLAGCSSGANTGAPRTTPSTSAAASGAPRVAHPLDASKMLQDPCSSLTTSDLTGLGIDNPTGKPRQTDYGPLCTWSSLDGVGITWEKVNTNGLSDLYQQKSSAAYWIPITVSGYPAVFADTVSDSRPHGDCEINVGVNDHLYFFADYQAGPGNDACPKARQAAADVIRNLGGS